MIPAQPDLNQTQSQQGSSVLLGMSGGVDSSVAAFLLKEQGYTVYGLSLLTSDIGKMAVKDAETISRQLGIAWEMADVRDVFHDQIISDFVDAYAHGRTPNPCVKCNPEIKFKIFSQAADRLGCQFIATGHYARVETMTKTGRFALAKTQAGLKDQTYFMYRLPQNILARILFPLSDYQKPQVRALAHKTGLISNDGLLVSEKPDSQDNCFISGSSYAEFIRHELEASGNKYDLRLFNEGPVVDMSGRHIGTHKGLIHYTLGQRKGFNVKTTERLFVIDRNEASNTLVVGPHKHVMVSRMMVSDPVFSGLADISEGERLEARIRNSAKEAPCSVYPQPDGRFLVVFDQPVSAPAPGQSCVFYRNGLIMAGGFIDH